MARFKTREEYEQWKAGMLGNDVPSWTDGEHTARETATPRKLGEEVGDGFSAGCMTSILCLVVGGLVSLIPVIGWIVGPFIILGAFAAPFLGGYAGFQEKKKGAIVSRTINGPCPYCGAGLEVSLESFDGIVGVDCAVCRKRIVVKDKIFHAV